MEITQSCTPVAPHLVRSESNPNTQSPAKTASNDSWPLSWRRFGTADFTCIDDRYGE